MMMRNTDQDGSGRSAVARVVVDVPSRSIDRPFDYSIPEGMNPNIGSCVLVTFGHRPVVGYVIDLSEESAFEDLKPLTAVLGGPYFSAVSVQVARWIADTYVCPISEALRLFLPPGGTPRAQRAEDGWRLVRPEVGPVDDRWAERVEDSDFRPRAGATVQRAILSALSNGPVRTAELSADLGSVSGALRRLEDAGAVRVYSRRRVREAQSRSFSAPRHERLSDGQQEALRVVTDMLEAERGVAVLDGVTGSGKTEVYLRAIERVLEGGGDACVLVPEISLTPQTVGRFRARFGDDVAVLHSRLSAGERFDQWDRVHSGDARIVVGARSALFAPFSNLRLIVIDEEHESSYKQGSSPRYHARDVAEQLASRCRGVLVLGSASPSMEALDRCERADWVRVSMPRRVTGHQLPPCEVVDMAHEFEDGHRSMFSRPLTAALQDCRDAGEKAVMFLNRRGFASFLLCRECGYVPQCEQCAVSLTYHEVGRRLACHHCGYTQVVLATCPRCSSPYLRQFGAGTQRVQAELESILPGWPVVRMDADTTKGKGAHDRLLAEFEDMPSGVLLGTQMIAKGLDYPEVTLVGVISADVTLNLPDFRAGERTYQLLEQVAGRAGRGSVPGKVIIQTYWPDHPAVVAAARHEPELFYAHERESRRELRYPPYARLVNVLIWGRDDAKVRSHAAAVTDALRASLDESVQLLGPSPSPLSKLQGVWRHHILLKADPDMAIGPVVASAVDSVKQTEGVSTTIDVDPIDLL